MKTIFKIESQVQGKADMTCYLSGVEEEIGD